MEGVGGVGIAREGTRDQRKVEGERERDRGREMSVNNSILEYKRFGRPQIELVYG